MDSWPGQVPKGSPQDTVHLEQGGQWESEVGAHLKGFLQCASLHLLNSQKVASSKGDLHEGLSGDLRVSDRWMESGQMWTNITVSNIPEKQLEK